MNTHKSDIYKLDIIDNKLENRDAIEDAELDIVTGGYVITPSYTQYLIKGIINQQSTNGKFATNGSWPYYPPLH
ncbi:hypothetical protein [Methylobacterium nonmethylotrophicum]|uniref:Uncharacterized protein n=1 Tax=Methylobacterium nonmethylotrophicum TaxID=1141884 RepID=A0A4Z0NCA3_9HYPH|nr:hypothetical protein [Methylobacterium nonmethylotrophicum]TGD91409.1 hypothetical protein EU555_35835 [Methylobacterium nonmethylotrophicum]